MRMRKSCILQRTRRIFNLLDVQKWHWMWWAAVGHWNYISVLWIYGKWPCDKKCKEYLLDTVIEWKCTIAGMVRDAASLIMEVMDTTGSKSVCAKKMAEMIKKRYIYPLSVSVIYTRTRISKFAITASEYGPEENGAISRMMTTNLSGWRHQMETLSALLAICAGNSPVTDEFPAQRASDVELWCFLWSVPEETVE